MRYVVTVVLLLLTSGLPLMPTGPLRADDRSSAASGCNDRRIAIEQRADDAGPADESHRMLNMF